MSHTLVTVPKRGLTVTSDHWTCSSLIKPGENAYRLSKTKNNLAIHY